MKIAVILLFSKIVLYSSAYAKCQDHYLKKINEISAKMNPVRTTLFVNVGAEVIIIPTLIAAGTTVPIFAVITVPAVAIAAGGFLGILAINKNSYRKVFLSIHQAKTGKGKILERTIKRVQRRNQSLSREEIINEIISLNSSNIFCPIDDETGNIKISKFNSFIKTLSNLNSGA